MNARRLAVLLVAALALVAAGCGGDDGEDSAATAETTVVEETTGTTEDDGSEMTETDDGSTTLGGECAQFAGLSAKLSQAFAGTSPDLDSVSEVFEEVADQVPEEIRDDYEVLAANFDELADALKGIDLSSGETPSPEAIAKLQQLSSQLSTPEVQEATQNIEAWAQANC